MDKKRASLGLNLSSKKRTTPENKVFSGFHSPVSNKSTSLYKNVLKDSVGKQASSHSKVRFSLGDSIKESPREQKRNEEFDFHCSFESDEENSPNISFSCTQPVSQDAILQGVIAYIEARSNTENRFEGISKQMELLGAVVVKKFIPEVTHVIFKDGKKSTREKALKKGIHLVNVLWVESCRESGKRVPEDLFPVVDEVHTPLVTGKLKRTKSMQPRSFEDDVRNSAERINRKKQRKIASERTPTSILSPLTLRLLSEDSPAPASPLVSSSMKHVPDTAVYSEPNSPDHKDRDSKETEVPSKRLNFVDTPLGSPLSAPVKTPVSPKTIPTDILQTASGPGKKRKRLLSSKDSTPKEPDDKPHQNKKSKPAKTPHENTDVFTFDEEEVPDVKTSKLKRTRKPRSKSTSGVETMIVEESSCAAREDELENNLRANSLAKKTKGKRISSSKQEDAQLKSTSGKGSGSRDVERDLDNLVCATGLSDSGVSFSEVEMQEKKTKVLKKNKRTFEKTEKTVGEVVSTEDENELEDVGKKTEPLKSKKKTESIAKKTSDTKRGKQSVSKKKNEKKTMELTRDEDKKLPGDICNTAEDDDGKKNDAKKMKAKLDKNDSRRKKMYRKNISKVSDDEDDVIDDDDGGNDDDYTGNGKGKCNFSRKKPVRKTIPNTDDEDDVIDNNDDGDDDDDDNGKRKNILRRKRSVRKTILDTDDEDENDIVDNNHEDGDYDDDDDCRKKDISRKTKPVLKKIFDDTDDDDDDDDDGNDDRSTEDDGDKSDIHDGDYSEEDVSHKSNEKQNNGKQKTKEKKVVRKKPSRSLVLTSMHFSEQDIVISVVRKLGGFYIADTVGPSTTHVISGSPRRTLNVLMAIAQGNWLVSPEWVMKSLETGYWVDEEPYELADAFPSAQLSRLERVSSGPDYHQELFAEVDPIFVSDNTSPPRETLIQLITLCGGKICTSIRKAGVVVGTISRKTKTINVSERWVLDSITEHTALSFDPYVFNPTKSNSPTF